MSLKFGFGKKPPPKASASKLAFGGNDDDDDNDGQLPVAGKPGNTNEITTLDDSNDLNAIIGGRSKPDGSATKPKLSALKAKHGAVAARPDLSSLRTQQQRTSEAQNLDDSIFDYDAHYDAIHAADAAKKEAARQDALERKPKYMGKLLEAAEQRERDRLRARDKVLQKERDAEGDEFADKEQFVTGAYKAQQEEVRRAEEAERLREEEEEKKRSQKGMSGFYRNVMDEQEKRHREMVEAAANVKSLGAHADKESDEGREKSDAELAREMNAQGGHIEINDEGQVVDKRQLLKGGLNVSASRKAREMEQSAKDTSASARPTQTLADRGRTDARRAQRDRQTRMIEAQLEAQAKRAAEEEAEELQKREREAKSRKTEGEISTARERFLQRRRDAAAAKKAS